MADRTFHSRLSPEGRVVVPAEIRRLLDLGPGDSVSFRLSDDHRVELVSAKALVAAVRANNPASTPGDAVTDVRSLRTYDDVLAERPYVDNAEDTWDAETEQAMLKQLGLSQ